jgi:DNA-binding XRE family transcriptional regulator
MCLDNALYKEDVVLMTCKKCIHEKVCPHLRDEDAERCKQFADKDEYIIVKRNKRNTNGTTKTIGQVLYEKRKERKLTRKSLAEKVDVCPSTITAWENGIFYPNAIYLVSLADVFECTIDELCGRVK